MLQTFFQVFVYFHAFHWQADDDPLLVVFRMYCLEPPLTKLSGSEHVTNSYFSSLCIFSGEGQGHLYFIRESGAEAAFCSKTSCSFPVS